jgi:transcriptional regulator with XRE-family HTH domain
MLPDVDINKQFGRNVRKMREAKGWSQEDLAEASSLHRTYFSGIERGARNPTLSVVLRLALALSVSPAELLVQETRR